MLEKENLNLAPNPIKLSRHTLPSAIAFLLEKLESYENPQPDNDVEPGVNPITHLPRQQDL